MAEPDEPFTLENPKPREPKRPPPPSAPARQAVMFSGMKLLKNQSDLFPTDGSPESATTDSP